MINSAFKSLHAAGPKIEDSVRDRAQQLQLLFLGKSLNEEVIQ